MLTYGNCKYSCKTIDYCLRTILNIRVQVFTGHPTKGAAGLPVTSKLFSPVQVITHVGCVFLSFFPFFVCLMQPLSNQILVIKIFVRIEVIKVQGINSGISRE